MRQKSLVNLLDSERGKSNIEESPIKKIETDRSNTYRTLSILGSASREVAEDVLYPDPVL